MIINIQPTQSMLKNDYNNDPTTCRTDEPTIKHAVGEEGRSSITLLLLLPQWVGQNSLFSSFFFSFSFFPLNY